MDLIDRFIWFRLNASLSPRFCLGGSLWRFVASELWVFTVVSEDARHWGGAPHEKATLQRSARINRDFLSVVPPPPPFHLNV